MTQIAENQSGISLSAASLTIDAISLSYGANKVLNDVSVDVRPGEFFALLGPSGCGKTTLLRLIAGFAEAQSGKIQINGKDIDHLPPWKRNVGMVFQSYALWPHMTVARNVAFGLEERRLSKADIADKVAAALRLVGLTELAERRPSQLSGGQQQRVALARTIVIEPKILLLDEPLSNLDAKLRVQVRRELRELQQRLGLTTILVTHDQEEANTMCDRIAVMDAGVVQQIGPPSELYEKPNNLFVANFLGAANILSGQLSGTAERRAFKIGDLDILVRAAGEVAAASALMFRPQDILIAPPADQTDGLRLDGDVTFREFLGSNVRYSVRANATTILVDVPFHSGDKLFNLGERLSLAVPHSALHWVTN